MVSEKCLEPIIANWWNIISASNLDSCLGLCSGRLVNAIGAYSALAFGFQATNRPEQSLFYSWTGTAPMVEQWDTAKAVEFAEWIVMNGKGKVPRSILERFQDRFAMLEQFEGQHPAIDYVLEAVRSIPGTKVLKQLRADIARDYARLFLTIGRRDGFGCAQCGAPDRNLQIDHIVPVSKNGTNDLGNLQLLCPACNMTKSDKLGE